MTGVARITAERLRQVNEKGYTPEHDVEHDAADLALAAVSYLSYAIYLLDGGSKVAGIEGYTPQMVREMSLDVWPWESESFKPSDDPRVNLAKAGALVAATIDREEST